MTVAIVVLGGVAMAGVIALLIRLGRQEASLREELGQVRQVLADSQREAVKDVAVQMTDTIDRFHRQLGEFGQRLNDGQSSAGETLHRGIEETRRTLAEQLRGLVGEVNQQLSRSQETFGKQFEGATKVFGEVRGQLGEVAQMAQRMEALGREIEELQGILKAPKLRGQLGEAQLEEFLRQVLPLDFFTLQYRFADGSVVDAVIHLREHLVPIDAKFPLEAFQRMLAADEDTVRRTARREFERAVKGRVDEIADKYIRPGEGTFEFALMFIPAENIYYEVIVRDGVEQEGQSLLNYAIGRRVVPVSPNSFYAYLMTIATGLKGMQVEARAREILDGLGNLARDWDRFGEAFRVVGKHVSSAHAKFEDADKLAGRFSDRLRSVSGRAEAPLQAGAEVSLPLSSPDEE